MDSELVPDFLLVDDKGMTSGEIVSIATIIGTGLTFLGVTGIDSSVISSAITGVIALVTIVAAIYSHYTRPSATA